MTTLADIEVSGPPLASIVRPFTPHETYHLQLEWRDENLELFLRSSASLEGLS